MRLQKQKPARIVSREVPTVVVPVSHRARRVKVEADARAKAFKTKYYTPDLHRGVLVSPPFVAEALGEA
jgi:spermidine synthase